jgi:nucleoside-diphosphate-sugar epimerase
MPKVATGTVAVTGAAGFVGSHCVLQLLARGYSVKACVRDKSDASKVGWMEALPGHASGKLTVHSCEMGGGTGIFDEVFAACDAVVHTADGGFPSVTSGEEYAATNRDLLASIEKAPNFKRLIFTSSDEAMLDSDLSLLEANPIIDERRFTNPNDPNAYATSKIQTEAMYQDAAAASGGKWDVFHCNPGDIIGPIVSAHQLRGFQGDIAHLIEGGKLHQHANGRPWMTVDVRDVAEAHVRLLVAEQAQGVPASEGKYRYLLDTNDKVFRDDLGLHLNAAMGGPAAALLGMQLPDLDAGVGIEESGAPRRQNSSERCGKRACCAVFTFQTIDQVTKTCSGQIGGNAEKEASFLQEHGGYRAQLQERSDLDAAADAE